MKAQSFWHEVNELYVPNKQGKNPRLVKVFTHINKSRPGRKIREAQHDLSDLPKQD